MAEYFNELGCGITEIAFMRFMHKRGSDDNDPDIISELVCPIQLIPHMIDLLQQTYNVHIAITKETQRQNNSNKSLS